MPVKTSGLEFKQWYNDEAEWPQDACHEDETIKINGKLRDDEENITDIADDAIVLLSGGFIHYETDGDVTKAVSMEGALRRWLRKKSREESFDRILVEIPKGARTSFVFHVEFVGGKVLA
jgi:hypothetical protein